MNKAEYNQRVRRNMEDIKRYTEVIETVKERLSEANRERLSLYHGGWTE